MEIQNKIGSNVFDKLRSKFKQITLGDTEGNSTQDPQEAVFFNFNYVDNQGHDHGNITISLIDQTMKIYYSKNISTELEGTELTEWYAFLQDMRKTAMSNLYKFDTHDISKSNLDTADIQATVSRNDVKEAKMYGSTKSSYQKQGPAKIIVRHNESIDPEVRGSRSRKVESVFVETCEGERFKMPFNSLPGTRAMAQHIGQGGRPYDAIGESITTMVNEISSLRPFIARNRNAIYEDETTMEMIESAKEYYAETRKTLGKLKGKRGYKAYAESFEVTEATEFGDDTANSMKDRFTKKRFGDKMEAAMPVVHKAYSRKNMKPKKPEMKPIQEFEEWAESTTEMPADTITENCSSILSDQEIAIVHQFLNQEIMDLPYELEAKLVDHYADEIPYGWLNGDDGTPQEWLFDKLDMEYGDEVFGQASQEDLWGAGLRNESKEEQCSPKCCGPKTISECKCGPECPHCDCHAINESRKINEVKSGPFNSKVIGRRAKVYGQPEFGDVKYNGEEGEIVGAEREHTFSQMVPFKVVYKLQMDDGNTVRMRRENVRPVKAAPVTEEQLDEGILQSVFDFMWNMAGKIPSIAANRKSKRLAQEYNNFVEKMDDETIEQWTQELVSKLKSEHPNTLKAKTGRIASIKKIVERVKASKNEKDFANQMQRLQGQLKSLEKYIRTSNKGVADRKRKANFNKAVDKPSRGSKKDQKLASWLKKGGRKQDFDKLNSESVMEGTWAIPDTPEKQERLAKLMSAPVPFGPDGQNATSALYDLLGDDGLFDELYSAAKEFGPEADARITIQSFLDSIKSAVSQERGLDDWPEDGSDEHWLAGSLNEDEELTQSIVNQLASKLVKEYPESLRRNGMDYTYAIIHDAVSWVTDDWPEGQGFQSSDRSAIWHRIVKDLELEQEVDEARGRAPHERMKQGDVVMPKATYSDYLEVYKTSQIGGTDSEDDAKRMVSALKKKGKEADHKAAKGALKRMAEQAAKTGLHTNEGLNELEQLRRDAGIIK